jgi:hypothetical protein
MARPAKSVRPKTPTKPKRAEPPYRFILEALAPLDPLVRPMFSGYSVYVGDKIVCMLRDRPKAPEDNGLWLVFSESADVTSPALRREFPSLREIGILGGKITHWLILPADGPDFESEALNACDLILKHDPRLGRIPKSRQSKTSR